MASKKKKNKINWSSINSNAKALDKADTIRNLQAESADRTMALGRAASQGRPVGQSFANITENVTKDYGNVLKKNKRFIQNNYGNDTYNALYADAVNMRKFSDSVSTFDDAYKSNYSTLKTKASSYLTMSANEKMKYNNQQRREARTNYYGDLAKSGAKLFGNAIGGNGIGAWGHFREEMAQSSAERAALDNAAYQRDAELYNTLTKRKDFAEKSKPDNKLKKKDSNYLYLNSTQEERQAYSAINTTFGGRGEVSVNDQLLDAMSPEQIAIYNYLYKTEGKKSAKAYLDMLAKTETGTTALGNVATEAQEKAKKNPALMGGARLFTQVAEGYTSLLGIGADILGNEAAANRFMQPSVASGAVAREVENQINTAAQDKWYGKHIELNGKDFGSLATTAYKFGDSAARSVISSWMLGGNAMAAFSSKAAGGRVAQALITAPISASAYGDDYYQARQNGASDAEAKKQSFVNAGIEWATEVMGGFFGNEFGNLPSKTMTFLGQMSNEALEEITGDILSKGYNILESLATGKENDLQIEYRELVEQGYSAKEAVKIMLERHATEAAITYLGTTLSMAPNVIGHQTMQNRAYSQKGNEIKNATNSITQLNSIINTAEAMSNKNEKGKEQSEAAALAKKLKGSKNVSNAQIGELYYATLNEVQKQINNATTPEEATSALKTVSEAIEKSYPTGIESNDFTSAVFDVYQQKVFSLASENTVKELTPETMEEKAIKENKDFSSAINEEAKARMSMPTFNVKARINGNNVILTTIDSVDGEHIVFNTAEGNKIDVNDDSIKMNNKLKRVIQDSRLAYRVDNNTTAFLGITGTNVFIENAKAFSGSDTKLKAYNDYAKELYSVGLAGYDYDFVTSRPEYSKIIDYLGTDVAKAMLEAGATDAGINTRVKDIASKTDRKTNKKTTGEASGKYVNETEDKGFDKIGAAVAKAWGIDLYLGSNIEGSNGRLHTSKGIVELLKGSARGETHALGHEAIGEVLRAYNRGDYNSIVDTILKYAAELSGVKNVSNMVQLYYKTYLEGQPNSTIQDAREELANDLISSLVFGNEHGQKVFAEHLANKQDKTLIGKFKDFVQKIIDTLNKYLNKENLSDVEKSMLELDKERAEAFTKEILNALDVAAENMKEGKDSKTKLNVTQHSLNVVIGNSGKNYGMGVILDDNTLDNLSDEDRTKFVMLLVKEMAGKTFQAFNNNTPIDIRIVTSKKYLNEKGKKVPANRDLLTKNRKSKQKQSAINQVEEVLFISNVDKPKPSKRSHGWLDDNGNNDWKYRTAYLQEKNKSVWEATLNISETASGELYLYDIDPIKLVEAGVESPLSTNIVDNTEESAPSTTNKIPQNVSKVNTQNSYDVKKYDEAVKEGNLEKAQEQVDKKAIEWGAFSEDGKTPLKFYHGSPKFGFTKFKNKDGKIFFTSDINTAQTYSGMFAETPIAYRPTNSLSLEDIARNLNAYSMAANAKVNGDKIDMQVGFTANGPNIVSLTKEEALRNLGALSKRGNYALFARFNKPLTIDAMDANWDSIDANIVKEQIPGIDDDKYGNRISTNDIADIAKEAGYESVIFKNIVDEGNAGVIFNKPAKYVAVVFKNADVRSADAITYDNKNKVIPLDKRFSDDDDDIRYSKDIEYLNATINDNEKAAQELVDKAAMTWGAYSIDDKIPLKLYHGTLADNFNEFKKELIGSRFYFDERGFFFHSLKSIAEDYASDEFERNKRGHVINAYIQTKNPFIFDKSYALRNGYGNVFRDNDAIGVWDAYQGALLDEIEGKDYDAIVVDEGEYQMVVAFEPNQIKSADPVTYDDNGTVIPLSERFTDDNDIRYSKDVDTGGKYLTENQQKYFKNSKARDDDNRLQVVYHGTVHDFTVFNRDFANSEGDWGKGFYFTTSYDDVEQNYANEEGPDLVNKIEAYLDRHEYDDEFEGMDRDEIRDIVKQRFITAEPNIIEAYLNITNPVYRGENETFFDYIEEYDEEFDEYGEPEGDLVDLVEALENTKDEFEFYGDFSVWAMLGDYYANGMSLSDIVTALEDSVGRYIEVTDEEGNFAHKEWLRRALEEMGYDGIIDTTVSDRFNTMNGLYSDTTHYIVFNSNQAKRTDNLNPTENEDIRYSKDIENVDLTEYNEITLNNKEYARLYHEAMKFDSVKTNRLLSRTLSNEMRYYYWIDNENDMHVVGKEKSINIHERNQKYAYGFTGRFNTRFDNVESSRRYSGSSDDTVENRGTAGEVLRYNDIVSSSKRENGVVRTNGIEYSGRDSYSKEKLSKDVVIDNTSALVKENKKLQQTVEYYKMMLGYNNTEGGAHKVNREQIRKIANETKRAYNSSMSVDDIVDELTSLYDFISSGNATWNTVSDIGMKLGRKIVESQKGELTEDQKESLEKLKTYTVSISEEQRREIQYYYGSISSWLNTVRKGVKYSTTGVPLDVVWQELSQDLPYYFESDTNAQDMPMRLAEAVESITDKSVNDYGYTDEEMAEMIAYDLFDKYFAIPEIVTPLDKAKTQLNKERIANKQRLEDVKFKDRAKYERDVKKIKEYYQDMNKRLRDTKNQATLEKLAKQKAKYEDKARKTKDTHERSALRSAIRKRLNKILTMAANPTKDKHIPNPIIEGVKALCEAVTLDGTQYDVKLTTKLNDFRNSFVESNIDQNSEYAVISNLYNEYISQKLDELNRQYGKTQLRDLSAPALKEIKDLVDMTIGTINNINRLFNKEKNKTVSSYAQEAKNSFAKMKKERTYDGTLKGFFYENMKPVYFFNYLNNPVFMDLYDDLRSGEDTWITLYHETEEFKNELRKKTGYNEWEMDAVHEFETVSGKIELTLGEMLAVYANSLGEHTRKNLLGGGFVYDVQKRTGLNRFKKARNNHDSHRLAIEDVNAIVGSLSKEQQNYVKQMIEYMSTTAAEWGNQVSRTLYGVELYKEKSYFPALIAKTMRRSQGADKTPVGTRQLVNSGFTKSIIPEVKLPLTLADFDNTVMNHLVNMISYRSFVIPLENFDRVYHYVTVSSNNDGTLQYESIEAKMRNAFGDKAAKYIENLLTDINGGAMASTDYTNKFISLFKKGAVFASASVVVQQPSAIGRALSVINPKYFIGDPTRGFRKSDYNEMLEYCPVARIKKLGYFDTGMAHSAVESLNAKKYEGKEKIKAFFVDGSYRDEAMSFLAAKADEITWTHIWNACKKEAAAKYSNLSEEEQKQKASKRFTEVITKTQVYDSVFSRSGTMRNKNTGMKMATSFMAEPLTSLNMLVDATVQAKRGNISKKAAARTLGSLVLASAINAVLQTLVTAARHDKDDDDWKEVYLAELLPNFLDNLNPAKQIPILRDVISIFEGYDVTRADMSVFTEVEKAVENLSKDTISTQQKIIGLSGSIANCFGIPLKNIMRDGQAVANIVKDMFDDYQFNDDNAREKFKEEMNSLSTISIINKTFDIKVITTGTTARYDKMFRYLDKGKYQDADKLMKEIIDLEKRNGKDEKTINTDIKSKITSHYKQKYLNGDSNTRSMIVTYMTNTGLYGSREDVNEYIRKHWTKEKKQ